MGNRKSPRKADKLPVGGNHRQAAGQVESITNEHDISAVLRGGPIRSLQQPFPRLSPGTQSRGRGRPRKKHVPREDEDFIDDDGEAGPSGLKSRPASQSPSKSPSKKSTRGKSVNRPLTEAQIDMSYLKHCKPSVTLQDVTEAKAEGLVPDVVKDIWKSLRDTPDGFVPNALKVSIRIGLSCLHYLNSCIRGITKNFQTHQKIRSIYQKVFYVLTHTSCTGSEQR